MYWLTGFLGLIAVLSPMVFGFTSNPLALWTSLTVGAVLILTSVMEAIDEDRHTWEYWIAGITGVAAMAAPFIFGFYGIYAAVWTMMIVGLVTTIAVTTRLTEKNDRRFRY